MARTQKDFTRKNIQEFKEELAEVKHWYDELSIKNQELVIAKLLSLKEFKRSNIKVKICSEDVDNIILSHRIKYIKYIK